MLSGFLMRSVRKPDQLRCILVRMMSSSSSSDEVILEKVDNKGVITLNRPKALNALNLSMIRKIMPKLQEWSADPETKMVLVKGAGEKAFCAGGDIRSIAEAKKSGGSLTADFFREEYQLNNLIGTLEIPYVSLLNGITMGGGCGLSQHGAFKVATEKTVLAMPECAIGFFPDVGGSYFLSRLQGKIGLYLALTGYRLTSKDVKKAGLATHFVTSDEMDHLERDILKLKNPTLHDIDKIIRKYQEDSEIEHKKEFSLKHVLGKINTIFNSDTLEEILNNLKKDKSDWATQQMETMLKQSPTSMKVSIRLLKEGGRLTLQEALKMEYRVCQRFMEGEDFFEGVRSVIIDKDQSPKWKPAQVEDVSNAIVDKYFEKLPSDRELKL